MMNKENMVFVVIPVYNAGKTLKRCLDSLKSQTYADWQALLIDDASSDNSGEIIAEYMKSDNRFLYIRHEKNRGASQTRNTGLERIGGKYTAFLDSDDFWEPDMLEKLVFEAQKKDSDVVQCRFIYDFSNGQQVLPKGAFSDRVYLEGKALRRVYIRMMTGINMNHVCMKLIKTSLLKDLRFDETFDTAEDLELCIRLFKRVKKYSFIPDVLYHYVRNEDSITGRGMPFKKRLRSNIRASKRLVEALPEYGIDNLFYRVLASLRPYIIIVSKIFRIIREKIVNEGRK